MRNDTNGQNQKLHIAMEPEKLLFQKFRESEKKTFVIIAHDTRLSQYAQQVIRLRDGKVEYNKIYA